MEELERRKEKFGEVDCFICQKKFIKKSHRHKICSNKCRIIWNNRNNNAEIDTERNERGYIYILGCWNNKIDEMYYVGETTDILQRLSTHCKNFGQYQSTITSNYNKKILLYIEIIEKSNRYYRLNRERKIKKMNIEEKEELINKIPKKIKIIVEILNFLMIHQ